MDPTRPDEGLYVSQELRDAGVSGTVAEFADLIDEVVAFGTRVLAWVIEATSGKPQHVRPAVMLLRRGLELGDGVAVLVRASAPDAAVPTLRVLLEALLQFQYLLQSDLERRGRAFHYFELVRELKTLRRADPTTPEGKAFRAGVQGDELLGKLDPGLIPDVPERRADLEAALASDVYAEIRAEEERLRTDRKNHRG